MTIKKIHDISLSLNEKTVVYPGNPPFVATQKKSATGSSVISEISFGTHSGTHIDAPSHAIENAKTIDQIPLETVVGACRVLDVTRDHVSISRETLETKHIKKGERILLKSQNSLNGFEVFNRHFVYVSPDAAHYLAECNISLLGFDYFSVKQRGSADNTPHTHLLSKNIAIVEGLDLSKIAEGEYTLVVLPLKLAGLDGAPARAILLE